MYCKEKYRYRYKLNLLDFSYDCLTYHRHGHHYVHSMGQQSGLIIMVWNSIIDETVFSNYRYTTKM